MPNPAAMAWIDRTDVLHRETEHALIYRVRNASGVIIYIGMTLSELGRRFGAHTPSSWWDEAATVESCIVPRQEARDLEGAEIHRWHPAGNKQCPECGRLARPAGSKKRRSPATQRANGVEINTTVLKATRIRSMLTLQELADKVDADCQDVLPAGITRDSLSKYERGDRRPRPPVVKAIARILGCDPNSLVLQSGATG